MSYCVEYFLKGELNRVRSWLSGFKGSWSEDPMPGELLEGEFDIWDGFCLIAYLAPEACSFHIPLIKYSWLIHEHPHAIEAIDRFERMVAADITGTLIVRIDEFVREEWEIQLGRRWEEQTEPVECLCAWLSAKAVDPEYDEIFGGG